MNHHHIRHRFLYCHKLQIINSPFQTVWTWLYCQFVTLNMYHRVCMTQPIAYLLLLHMVMTYTPIHYRKYHQKQHCMKILYSVCVVRKKMPFFIFFIPSKIPQKYFCVWWRIFNAFVLTCEVVFSTTHGQNNTSICDTEGFVFVGSLNGVVGLLSLFIRSFIGSTRKMLSSVYINAKWI